MKKLFTFGCLVVLLVSSASAQLADSPWPMFGHDPRHTGQSEYKGPEVPELKWSYDTRSWGLYAPIIGPDNTVYAATFYLGTEMRGEVYAFNVDGSIKWICNVGKNFGFYSAPALDDNGTLFIGSLEGEFYAIDSLGKIKWSYKAGNEIFCSSPLIGPDGTIYVGVGYAAADGELYAFNPNGTVKWNLPIGLSFQSISSSPAMFGKTIYIGANKKLYAIDTSGTEKWSFPTEGYIQFSPAVSSDGTTIYFGSCDSIFYIIDSSGTEKNSYQTGGEICTSPVVDLDGNVYLGSNGDKFYAFDSVGNLLWSYPVNAYQTPAIDAEGTIYVPSWDDNLHAIKSDGSLKWTFEAHGNPLNLAIDSDGRIYFGSKSGKFYCLGEKDSVGVPETVPEELTLFRNYPNPFRQNTAISYQLSARTKISLEIYSVTGRLIRTLVNGKQKAGRHSIIWDGKDEKESKVASGIYFYRLKGGEIKINKKMVLL